jgi:cystathionine beta-lyase
MLSLQPGGGYGIDFEALEAAITPQTRIFLLCNPHNPVGRVYSRAELERLAEICLRHDLIICSDEIHADLVYLPHQHIPISSLDPDVAKRTITLMAPSKTFNLAGLQCSFAVVPNDELRQTFLQAARGLVPWVNLMGLVAAQAAYSSGGEWLDQLLPYLQANRDFLRRYVESELPGVSLAEPEGTYLAWLDCRASANPQAAADPFNFFLEQACVALVDGKSFGPGGDGFVRLNFGCPRSALEAALMRMKNALLV